MSPEIETQTLDGCMLVRPPGPRLDAISAPALKNVVVDLANAGHLRIVLSLSRLELIDSSGLGSLISMHKNLAPPRGRLVLCDLSPKVGSVLKLTRLDRVLTIAADSAAAADLARAN